MIFVPAFGSDVPGNCPKQRRIVVPRGAGGDARKRIPVINKIHEFASTAGIFLARDRLIASGWARESLTFPSHSQYAESSRGALANTSSKDSP
jgi:hypothetical protein